MNNQPLTLDHPVPTKLDEIVEAFESHWTAETEILPYLSEPGSPDRSVVACELIRLDLEYRWRSGEHRLVESYLPLFGADPPTPEQLAELAFEEFRVRSQFDHPVAAEIYRQRFGVDTSQWPERSEQRGGNASSITTSPSPSVGEQFLNFDLIGEIGQGVSGRVYLARQLDLANRIVVVKISKSEGEEPETLARLQHTNIIPIFSRQRRGALECICMPLLGLVTLRDLFGASHDQVSSSTGRELISTVAKRIADTVIETTGTDPHAGQQEVRTVLDSSSSARMPALAELDRTQTLLWMTARIADALEFAHRKGIVHGDIKPANVLVSDDGQPIILDFHLSQSAHRPGLKNLAGGTLPYMSPEHLMSLLDGRRLTPSCDIFGLGVLLYEGLTGHHPYPVLGLDDDSIRRMASERFTNLPPLHTLARFSPAAASIVEQCLLPPGRSCYENAQQLSMDLECQLQDRPLRFAPNRSVRERLVKFSRRHPRLTSNACLVTFFSLLAFAVFGIINAQFRNSAKILASEASRNFVAELDRLVTPLTTPIPDSATAHSQREKLQQALRTRRAPSANLLDAKQFQSEKGSVAHALYWLATSYLNSSRSIAESQNRMHFLSAAAQEIDSIQEQHTAPVEPLNRILNQLHAKDETATLTAESESHSPEPTQSPSPNRISQLLSIGEARTRRQDRLAIQLADKLLAETPADSIAWLLKGHSHLRLKDREKAELCYSMCLHLDPEASWGYFYRGMAELEGGKLPAARQDFTEYISRESSDPSGYLNRALVSRGMNDFKAAIADLNSALEMNCSQTRALYLRSQLHARAGNAEMAQADLEAFLQSDPSDELSWISRGLAFAQRSELDAARRDFEAALTINPDSKDAIQNLATLDSEYCHQLPQAVSLFDRLIELDGTDPVAWVTRGVLHGRLGQREQAQRDAKRALQIASNSDVTYRAAGVYALTAHENPEDRLESIRLLHRAAQSDPRLVYARATSDPDLGNIQTDKEFLGLMETLKKLLLSNAESQSRAPVTKSGNN